MLYHFVVYVIWFDDQESWAEYKERKGVYGIIKVSCIPSYQCGRTNDDHVFVVNKRENHPASRYHSPINVLVQKELIVWVFWVTSVFSNRIPGNRQEEETGGEVRMIMTLFSNLYHNGAILAI